MSINSATKCQDHPQIKILVYRSFPLKLRKIHRQHTKMLFQLIKVKLRVVGGLGNNHSEFRIANEWLFTFFSYIWRTYSINIKIKHKESPLQKWQNTKWPLWKIQRWIRKNKSWRGTYNFRWSLKSLPVITKLLSVSPSYFRLQIWTKNYFFLRLLIQSNANEF